MSPHTPGPSIDLLFCLQELIRHLTHQLRTPLAVVANDLAYLHRTTEDPNLERPLRRTKEISILLGDLQSVLLLPLSQEVEKVCRHFVDGEPLAGATLLSVALSRFEFYLSARYEEFGKRLSCGEELLELHMFSSGSSILPTEGTSVAAAKGLHKWLKQNGEHSSLEPILLDAAVSAHGGELEAYGSSSELSIVIRFPL